MAEDDDKLMTDPDELNDLVAAALAEANPDSGSEDTETITTTYGSPEETAANRIELLNDVDLHVKVELGRTQMLVEDVLRLGDGSIVELDKLAGDPVDVYVNGRLVARGEVLVLNDNFCIRISEILANLEEQAQAVAQLSGAGS